MMYDIRCMMLLGAEYDVDGTEQGVESVMGLAS